MTSSHDRPKRPPKSGRCATPAEIAESAARKFRRAGAISSEAPTAERLLRAAGHARVESFRAPLSVEHGGQIERAVVSRLRVRIEESPLERLRARCLLDPSANGATRNDLLAAAGNRYLRHWRGAGLSPLRAIDFTKERVSGGDAVGLLRSERQIAHHQAYQSAATALGRYLAKVVDAVVLQEREPLEVGREISAYRQEKQATAIALHSLRDGLESLAIHFGLIALADE